MKKADYCTRDFDGDEYYTSDFSNRFDTNHEESSKFSESLKSRLHNIWITKPACIYKFYDPADGRMEITKHMRSKETQQKLYRALDKWNDIFELPNRLLLIEFLRNYYFGFPIPASTNLYMVFLRYKDYCCGDIGMDKRAVYDFEAFVDAISDEFRHCDIESYKVEKYVPFISWNPEKVYLYLWN